MTSTPPKVMHTLTKVPGGSRPMHGGEALEAPGTVARGQHQLVLVRCQGVGLGLVGDHAPSAVVDGGPTVQVPTRKQVST
jgi:hypothetical protein